MSIITTEHPPHRTQVCAWCGAPYVPWRMDENVIALFCGCYCWEEPRDELPEMEPDDDWEEY